jgi:hypothetical protein
MADGVMVPCAVRSDDDLYSRMSHIERINGWENPAAIPGIFYGSPVNRPGEDETFTEQQS